MLSPLDVAERLAVSRSTIYDLIARREIPAVRIGRQ
jgi:excisionase family DNA binding protein